jgi:hypothetical protein
MIVGPVGRRWIAGLAVVGLLAGCATRPPSEADGPMTWAGRAFGAPPTPDPALRQAILARATEEWELFGRQVVVLEDGQESIPRVGAWEDEDAFYSARVNAYWRAVGRPLLNGMDCQKPWSAAFVSWVMQQAGVPEEQFPAAAAHGVYLAQLIEDAELPGRWFVPRRIADYSPAPGDLVCASRGPLGPSGDDASPALLRTAQTHCDLVVGKSGRTLEVVGGNVRNSVSKTRLQLDGAGRLQPEPRRQWFAVLHNRL